MSYLLDANVISELRKRDPNPHLLAWFDQVSADELYLSVLTIGEIRLGIERLRRRDAVQAAQLDWWLAGLQVGYRDHLVEVDLSAAQEWGHISAADPLRVIDGLLAASALVRDWTLVTRNVRDLDRCGVRLLNPFEPQPD